jgi:hypothetical protein
MPLDDNDKTEIQKIIAEALKPLSEQFVTADNAQKMVQQGVANAIEGLNLAETIKSTVTEAIGGQGGEGGDGGGQGGAGAGGQGGDGQPDPQVMRLQERQQELERKLREQETARQEAEAREKQNRLDGAVREALGAVGVPGERVPHAMAWLKTRTTDDGKPVLVLDDQGRAAWRIQKNGYVDTLALQDGATAWLGTDDGKSYLPPTNRQGAGGGAGDSPNSGRSGAGDAPRGKDGALDWSRLGANLGRAVAGAGF